MRCWTVYLLGTLGLALAACTPDLVATIELEATLKDFAMDANCMPDVPADPIQATWSIQASHNSPDALTVQIVDAQLTYGDDAEGLFIAVIPERFSLPAGPASEVNLEKDTAIDPLTDPCSYCNKEVTLDILLVSDDTGDLGANVVEAVSATSPLSCVF